MRGAASADGPPTLLGITVRRSIYVGRVGLIAGVGIALFYGTVFSLAGGQAFETVLPLLLPLAAVMGGMGGLMVFTNDRLKGVFEYLLAYGVPPRRLFANALVASLVLVTIVMVVAVSGAVGVFVATGHALSLRLIELLAVYSFPMGYASVAFSSTVGMYWTSLSSPREGINSPVGLVPILGVVPLVGVLSLALARPALALAITAGSVVLLALVVLSLLYLVGRLLRLERLLSPT